MKSVNLLLALWYYCLGSSSAECRYADHGKQNPGAQLDKVELQLPDFAGDKVPFDHYAGYVTVSHTRGRALFYWLTEAWEDAPSKPLVLWLNGGPGCSSLYGAMEEVGPFHVNATSVYLNRFAWNRAANVLFLESPAGVGFSYSNTSRDVETVGDAKTARDAYVFLRRWFRRFPKYKHRDFYLAGESYAGHYVPQLAKLIHDKNKKNAHSFINLKGFIVGNALLDHEQDFLGKIDFWYTHALISERTHHSIVRSCNLKAHTTGTGTADECEASLNYAVSQELGSIDPYNIYAPVCLVASNSSSTRRSKTTKLQTTMQFHGYDPCVENHLNAYMNRADVQKVLHANSTGIPYPWAECSETVNENWSDVETTMLPVYRELIAAGLRIWVYSGDVDSVVPVTSTRYSLKKLNLTLVKPWYPWYRNQQVGGYAEVYKGLTLVTVRGAGHEVPLFKPGLALSVISSYLKGSAMPSQVEDALYTL